MKSNINEIEILGDLNAEQNEQVNKFIKGSKSYHIIQKRIEMILNSIDEAIDCNQSPTIIKEHTNQLRKQISNIILTVS
ncbi:MAG: hypothetical protein RO257_10465 [Candidatus Kapabacteria bacterium]|jgi:1-deoxy-D-xylulose 5-phosphate reductoisomerase|nr:hypothetical protein [Candidatus Kapabacteria bacterium]